MNRKRKRSAAGILVLIPVAAMILCCAVPFYFMVLNTLKTKGELLLNGTFALPVKFRMENYLTVLQGGFPRYFLNSVIVVAVSLLLLLGMASCAAYPLSRFRFKLRTPIYMGIVACMSIPIHITLIPVFQMAKAANVYDTLWALVGPDVAFAIPISVFLLTSFMAGIPQDLEDAAQIDGCGEYATFYHVILPLTKPGLATIAIYNGVSIWNEFSFAFTLTQSTDMRTIPLAMWDFQGRFASNMAMIMTVLTLSTLPMILMYIVFQEKLVKGMTAGAVKG